MSKARAYLELVRVPNLVTAVADVIAGFAYGGGRVSDWPMLLWLSASSVCLYAGGVALNDVCDATIDGDQRPDRPIPSGRVSVQAAKRLAIVLAALGIVFATWASVPSGIVATSLVVCVVLYDAVLKRHAIAPAIMGLCRSLNFCLPLAGLGVLASSPGHVLPLAAIWLYVTSLTYFAQGEAACKPALAVGRRRRLAIGTLGVCLSAMSLVGLHWTLQAPHDAFLVGVAAVVIALAYCGASAVRRPEPASIQRAVRAFVMLLVGLDVCIAWASRGSGIAVVVAGLLVLAVILGSNRVGLRVT